MDLDEFKSILTNSGTDIWNIINAAVTLASTDHPTELKHRRDGIIERLYTQPCGNCDVNINNIIIQQNDVVRTLQEDDVDPYGGLFDDEQEHEQERVFRIKEQLEDPHQETDIGRHVNRLRKHPSNEVRSLVKHLVRKWKDLVDEWVGSKNGDHVPAALDDGDSPPVQNVSRYAQNDHHQVPDFGYSPNPHNGSSGFERNNPEPEQQRTKAVRANKEQSIDLDRLASARKRLQENYQEAQNAKKQRTIQVMDIHEIPKPKNGYIAKNKGNFQGRHR
ncbi:hypothetical protein M8C21_009017 [Ambrosia artemisiifolia]|uniref:TFIIS N-terminal domain-containing protein n=1 Tax=Ambrosia artemisiifolia TaxID=4212 RepID=A0AAD5C893_AMBAR|nr:hypothetical protein M8C21_009017 [Ambrosia artemisiifolia]